MILENISGGKYSLTLTGDTLEHGDTVEVDDNLRWHDDIKNAIDTGKLQVNSYSTDAGSVVTQDEIAGLTAGAHTHTNKAELDLLTDGDHDVADGTSHANVVLNDTHRTGDGSDHANVATNDAHVAGDGSDHANVALNDSHRTGNGSDHADVATNTTHSGLTTGNPHSVTPAEVAASNDWTTPPTSTTTGEMVFDSTAGQPFWWDGSQWVDATGAAHP
jgi:hypothetical protein